MKLAKSILDIAKEARRRCEVYAQSGRSEPKHYHDQEDLRCMCATASAVLFEMLKAADLKSVYCNGHYKTDEKDEKLEAVNHCWLEVDGKILDITATQFGKSAEVYVTDADAARYDKKNEILDWQTMEWQWAQKPTPSIVTEIISVGEIAESEIVQLGMARTLLNEALEQSVFYTEDVAFTIRDSDTGNLYTGKHVLYHGESQLVVLDRGGNVVGWKKYVPPQKTNTLYHLTLVMDFSFSKELIRSEAAISEGKIEVKFEDLDERWLATRTAEEKEKIKTLFAEGKADHHWWYMKPKHYGLVEIHYGYVNYEDMADIMINSDYGVSPRYIVYMPRLLWSERLSKLDEMFNVTPDGFNGPGESLVSLSLPSYFIEPIWYAHMFAKALEAVGGTVGEIRNDEKKKCYTIDVWHQNNAIKIQGGDEE